MPPPRRVPTAAMRRLPPPCRACALCRQHGQALVLGIFLLLAGLAGTYFLFNTGQVLTEKNRLVTTADAVAYGAGVMLRVSGNNLILSPPLIITAADVAKIAEGLDAGLKVAAAAA